MAYFQRNRVPNLRSANRKGSITICFSIISPVKRNIIPSHYWVNSNSTQAFSQNIKLDSYYFYIFPSGHRDEVTDEEAYCVGEEPENQSVEEHKSVILHLLSQLKLGMDLTKVPRGALLQLHFLIREIAKQHFGCMLT